MGSEMCIRDSSYRPFDDSVLWWVRVVWVCHVCSVLFIGCVVSRVLCVVCWQFLAKIRTYVVMYVLLCGFFATARKHVRRENSVKI